MFEIDYSLVPLGDKDREFVAQEVNRRLKAGTAPELDRAHPGRVVVVNPDPVQTVHHVPDSLRAQLRRTMVSTSEGSLALRPEVLAAEILRAPEPIAALIIEVQDPFPHLPGFLDYLPLLRAVYPDMAVFLSGTAAHLMDKLAQVLTAGNNTLLVRYGDARGTLEISDPAEITQTTVQDPEMVSASTPFFSQLRLAIEKGKPPVAVNLDSLRKLHPLLGVGEAKEVDLGGGRKERMVTVDIPVRLIRDFQFRQDRGLDFHGIEQNGHFIPSRNFDAEKLELKWVPWRSLQSFQYKAPGEPVRRADLGKAKVLRVNCFSGQISFLTHGGGSQLSLHDTQLLAFQRQQAVALIRPEGSPLPVPEGRPLIHFDKLIVAGSQRAGSLDPVQQAVQDHYFGKLFQVEATQARKLEIYAKRLKVGAVGPLAAQMLKLLRRYGLEKVIEPTSFHYLCDGPEQLPAYQDTPGRFRAHFTGLVKQLKEIGAPMPSGKGRLDDVNHRLPIATEWMDAATVRFEDVTPEQLAALYREMIVLSAYIGTEFQRNYDLGQEDLAFFERMKACRAAGLLASWLSDYKTGTFGSRMPEGEFPDVVFFGSTGDKRENDHKYFFPGLACAEMFEQPANQKLFDKVDYEFGLFLEEELALAQHVAREDGVARPGLEHICSNLQTKLKEHELRVQTLVEQAQTLDATESAEYQKLVREEEQAYHERYRAFIQDRDAVMTQHQETGIAFQDLVLRLKDKMDLPDAPEPVWLAPGELDPEVFDRYFIAAGQRSAQRMKEGLRGRLQALVAGIKEALTVARENLQGNQRWLRTQQSWLQSQTAEALAQAVTQVRGQQEQRLATLRSGERQDLAGHLKRVQAMLGEAETELRQGQARLGAQLLHNLRPLQQLQGTLAAMQTRLGKLAQVGAAAEPTRVLTEVTAQVQHLMQLAKAMMALAERLESGLGPLLNLAQRNQRLAAKGYEQTMELALGRSILEQSPPEVPEPPARQGLQPAAELEKQFKAEREDLAGSRRRLAGQVMRFKPLLEQARREMEEYVEFNRQREEMERMGAKKKRLRATAESLAERQALMDLELKDLGSRVRERFIPARKKLLVEMFLPEAQRQVFYFRQAEGLLTELLTLSFERQRQLYLERAIHKRFSSRQFVHGIHVPYDPLARGAEGLRNITPSVNLFFRTVQHNMEKQHPRLVSQLKLDRTAHRDPQGLLELLRGLLPEGTPNPAGYVVLPSTYPLEVALRLMVQKDALFKGVPRVVLVYVSKFRLDAVQRDDELRELYFRAVRHNVVVNVDGRRIVDNPQAISFKLLQETLGCTFDTAHIEEIPEDDEDATTRVVG